MKVKVVMGNGNKKEQLNLEIRSKISYLTLTLSPWRLCRNGENAVIPAKAAIQVLEIVVVYK